MKSDLGDGLTKAILMAGILSIATGILIGFMAGLLIGILFI